MIRFAITVLFTLVNVMALVIAYQHTVTGNLPIVSGWIGLVIMVVLPQWALVILLHSFREKS